MAARYMFFVEGLDAIRSIEDVPNDVLLAARQAVNKTTDRARASAAREIRRQVALPASYLGPNAGRLRVAKYATGRDLEGVVQGRQRPISLARFARGSLTVGKTPPQGMRVEVKPGSARFMKGAFLMKLKAGSAALDTQFNLGLAVRTKDGRQPNKAYRPMPIGRGLWLLYGPSVDQVFRSVAQDIAPDQTDFLETEFLRLLETRRA
ncbi:MAG TPA: hypothetical protein VEC60_02980 [Reyranella sp.]|nr:hypothetical protein [Reyranella sp.]